MTVAEALSELLNTPPIRGDQHSSALLEEQGQFSQVKKILIDGLKPGDVFISLDNDYCHCSVSGCTVKSRVPVCRLFSTATGHGANCLCDAILFLENSKRWVLIELKSDDISHAEKQLQSVKCIVTYLQTVLSSFYSIDTSCHRMSFSVLRAALPLEKWTVQRQASSPASPFVIPVKDGQRLLVTNLAW